MDESRGFIVEAVQTIGVLVDEGVILGHELPADLGGIDRRGVGHGEAGGELEVYAKYAHVLQSKEKHTKGTEDACRRRRWGRGG